MGVRRAASAYSVIYGPHDRRVHRKKNQLSVATADDNLIDNNVCLIDLPTYHIPALCSVSSRAAAAIIKSDGKLGQMVVFSASGIIYDILFDENCCILPDDVRPGNIVNEEDLKRFKNYKTSTSFRNEICLNSFCTKFKFNVLSEINADVILIPVTAGISFDTVKKLRNFVKTNPHPTDFKPMPPQQRGTSTEFRDWLTMNNVPEATFISFEHVYNAMWKNSAYTNTDTCMYNCAKMAYEMEGFLLLYAVSLINKLKQLSIDKRKNNKLVLFTDGKPPMIKQFTKMKRDEARRNRSLNKRTEGENETDSEIFLHKETVGLFERVAMSIPRSLLQCVLLDVLRIPFFNQMKINDQFFFAVSLHSEAEDDIVKITAYAANIDTGVRGDIKTLTRIRKPEQNNRSDKIEKADLMTREQMTWKDACLKALLDSPSTSISIFSYDSDVLPKWNLMIKHSFDNRNIGSGHGETMKKSAENIESIYFYRSHTENWTKNNNTIDLGGESDVSEDGEGMNLLKRKSREAVVVNKKMTVSVYDLTQSPIMHSVESTLLLTLINGCDYVDALVPSSKTLSRYDNKIREEVALFERFACLCRLLEEEEEVEKEDFYKCHRCNKYTVPNFNTIKRFLLKYNVRRIFKNKYAAACNSAANVLAMLSLSCFNQRIFGSVASLRQNNSELSTHIMAAKHGFFSEYTQGGIPLCDSTFSQQQIESERIEMFKDLGSIKRSKQCNDNIAAYVDKMDTNSIFDTEDAREDDRILSLIINHRKEDQKSSAICFDNKKGGQGNAEENDEDIIEAILSKSKKKLKMDNINNIFEVEEDDVISKTDLFPVIDLPIELDRTTPPHQIIKEIDSAMMCEDTPSHAGTEDFILSLLTSALKVNTKIIGLDDKRASNMTYCEKVMDLLIILYLNMCGQQDPTISRYQYVPVIHSELISLACSKKSQISTTRKYFVAAMNEISFYMYRPELKETSKYSQTRRRSWQAMTEKLIGFDNEMKLCGIKTLCDKGSFIRPVYGLVRVKPWSTLSLLGTRLYYQAKSCM